MNWKEKLGFDPTPKVVYRHRCRVWEGRVEKLQAELREASVELREAIEQFHVADALEKKAQKQIEDLESKIKSNRGKMGQMRKEIIRGIAERTRLIEDLRKRDNMIEALRQNLAVAREQADNYAKQQRKEV